MRASLLLVAFAGSAQASPPTTVGVGGTLGTWRAAWRGFVVEFETRLSDALTVRVSGRWQHMSEPPDECSLFFSGRQLDLSAGVRWDVLTRQRVRPFLVADLGGA